MTDRSLAVSKNGINGYGISVIGVHKVRDGNLWRILFWQGERQAELIRVMGNGMPTLGSKMKLERRTKCKVPTASKMLGI